MKTKKIFLAALTAVLAIPAFGQWGSYSSSEGYAGFQNVQIGGYTADTIGEGARLYLNGFEWNGQNMFLSRYNNNSYNQTDLRVNIGCNRTGGDRFMVGNTGWWDGSTWESWFTVLNNGKVGIGTDAPYYKLDVNGTLRAKEIKVNLNSGADFVFEPGYRLKPLSEVQRFIQENRHLPEIPTANEMTGGDTDLGDLQVKLLQKIEELTLYVIQQNDEIQTLKDKLNKMETTK
ncbi:MAG: hypothetical protein LBR34_05680 [Prevotella sp.]|jgi:hypothetical protein|nr:hypothetical protein [Prevotella sp.]